MTQNVSLIITQRRNHKQVYDIHGLLHLCYILCACKQHLVALSDKLNISSFGLEEEHWVPKEGHGWFKASAAKELFVDLLEQNALEETGNEEHEALARGVFTGRRWQDVPKAGYLDVARESLPRETEHEQLCSAGWGSWWALGKSAFHTIPKTHLSTHTNPSVPAQCQSFVNRTWLMNSALPSVSYVTLWKTSNLSGFRFSLGPTDNGDYLVEGRQPVLTIPWDPPISSKNHQPLPS